MLTTHERQKSSNEGLKGDKRTMLGKISKAIANTLLKAFKK